MALFFCCTSVYNISVKNTFTLLLLLLLCFQSGPAAFAQRWKTPVKRSAQKAAHANTQKTAVKAAAAITERQIQEASSRAQKLWKIQTINEALDKKALSAWAMGQSIRVNSPAYQQAAKQLAFIRQNAGKIRATYTRDFVHVNDVKYAPFTKDKNQILVAAEWTPGTRDQINKLIKTLHNQNPQSRIIIASPFIPKGKKPYASGQYSTFYHENGPDDFFKDLLHLPNLLFVNLEKHAGSSVKNHWKSWLKTLSPHYSSAVFGKSQDVLVLIAPAKFIEGNANYLKHGAKGLFSWNKDQSAILSIRTREESLLTDFKWNIITAGGKKPLPAPYTSGWVLNAFVDQVAPEFRSVLGTDVIIRIHPQRPQKNITFLEE